MNRAGARIANLNQTSDDLDCLDQWRAAHGYVLNTFQSMFRKRIQRMTTNDVLFVQRLKRRKTVVDKLRRTHDDDTRLISDATSMQDYAGCRLIFNDNQALLEFREQFHQDLRKRSIDHHLKHDPNKFNYIENPKPSGYRRIHDILVHKPRPHRRDDRTNLAWHGLVAEIQYRTKVQNSWATALEMADLINNTRTKFDLKRNQRFDFFSLISELLARKYEGLKKSHLNLTDQDLIENINKLEEELQILSKLRLLQFAPYVEIRSKHLVLSLSFQDDAKIQLEVKSFRNGTAALEYANERESNEKVVNAVYARSESAEHLKCAFKNYFNDTKDFLSMLDQLRF